jgi:hypothetical protein
MSIEAAFRIALDDLYTRVGVDVTIPIAPGSGVMQAVVAIYETFDPANPPIGTEVSEWRAGEDRAIFAFRRGDVLDIPVGMLEAPEIPDGTVRTWTVESLVRKDPLELKVLARQVR